MPCITAARIVSQQPAVRTAQLHPGVATTTCSHAVVQARGCNLVEILGTEADSTLFGWSYVPDKLLSTLRILDLGNNWELTESGIDMLFGGMHLWEL